MATILTEEAMQGYLAAPGTRCPFYLTSDCCNAWHIGMWLNVTGRSAPRNVRASRGPTYHVNDMKVRIKPLDPVNIERIA